MEGRVGVLTLYAEQLGFLDSHRAIPQAGGKPPQLESFPRKQEYLDLGAEIPLPQISYGGYLLEAAVQMGFVEVAPNGSYRATSWSEILAFSEATNTISEPWEFLVVRRLCKAYALGRAYGSDIYAVAPMDRKHGEEV